MTGSKITGKVTQTVIIGQNGYLSPLTITTTGDVAPTTYGADGVVVPSALADTVIDNQGQIHAAAGGYAAYHGSGVIDGGVGVDLASLSQISNEGTIVGGNGGSGYGKAGISTAYGGNGIDLSAGGTVTNGGLISGGAGGYFGSYQHPTTFAGGAGVDIKAGSLSNAGTITGGYGGFQKYPYFGGNGGIGVSLSSDGTITNSGLISGGGGEYGSRSHGVGGIGVQLDAGTLVNSGMVVGGYLGGTGVELGSAQLLNSGMIKGGAGGYGHADGSYGGTGVSLQNAKLTSTGTIVGGNGGPGGESYGGPGGAGIVAINSIVVVDGTVSGGNGGTGAPGEDPANFGGVGVYLNGGTLTVSGTVSAGANGNSDTYPLYAVRLVGSSAGTLVVDSGAVFNGKVVANAAARDVLKLADDIGGTITGLGTAFTNFSVMFEAQGGNWTFAGSNTVETGQRLGIGGTANVTGTLTDQGVATVKGELLATGSGAAILDLITLRGGELQAGGSADIVAGSSGAGALAGDITVQTDGVIDGFGNLSATGIVDDGLISAARGTLSLDSSASGSGRFVIREHATLAANANLAGARIVFDGGTNETLAVAHNIAVTGTIAGFGSSDTIEVLNTPATSLAFAANTLTLENEGNVVASFHFATGYNLADFTLSPDTHGDSIITFGTPANESVAHQGGPDVHAVGGHPALLVWTHD